MSRKKSDVDLLATRALPIAQIDLEQLDDAQLAEIKAQEEADDSPRAGLLRNIERELESRAEAAGTTDAKSEPARTMADDEAAEDPLAYQAPDYAGQLTIPQAEWRRANLKPVGNGKMVSK